MDIINEIYRQLQVLTMKAYNQWCKWINMFYLSGKVNTDATHQMQYD